MDTRSMILGRLGDGPVYAITPRAFAKELGIDPTRQTTLRDVLDELDNLETQELIALDQEPDDLNGDPRLPGKGPKTWVYRLTKKGEQELERLLASQASA